MVEPDLLPWAAGLFEGEGCITVQRYRDTRRPHVKLTLNSTDEDTVRRFYAVAAVGSVGGPYSKGPHKPQWYWQASGMKADAFLSRLLPYLGERRRARADEVRAEVAYGARA